MGSKWDDKRELAIKQKSIHEQIEYFKKRFLITLICVIIAAPL